MIVRIHPVRILLASLLAVAWMMTPVFAAEAKEAKPAKPAKTDKPAAPAKVAKKRKAPAKEEAPPPSPVSDRETALASCKKHVESMLKESAVTRFQGDQELKVEHPDDAAFDISGWVTSQSNAGSVKRMDFLCHAQHSSGGLWTTKTSLFMDK